MLVAASFPLAALLAPPTFVTGNLGSWTAGRSEGYPYLREPGAPLLLPVFTLAIAPDDQTGGSLPLSSYRQAS